jgi:hypothetical protein
MEMLRQCKPADTAAEQAVSDETVRLIRKLRWLGLDAEAQQLEKKLEHHAGADTVVATECETD